MKRSLPLMAVLAATLMAPLAAPASAQDVSRFMDPGALAAHLGLGNRVAINQALATTLRAPATNMVISGGRADVIASLAPEVRSLAPRTSIAPIPRGTRSTIARVLAPSVEVAPVVHTAPVTHAAPALAAMMADAAEAAPAGANTVVINGINTAVIQSTPAPRLSLWQRLFGS